MSRSLKVGKPYIKIVKAALLRHGFPRQQDLAEAVGMSRDTVSKFLNGKSIGYLNFVEICNRLNLNWQEIADFQDSESPDIAISENSIYVGENDSGDKLDSLTEKSITECFSHDSFIFDLLLQIDFKPQVGLVREVIQIHRTAAFLVHGEIDCGHDLLMTRLFRIKSAWRNNSKIKNDVTNNGAYRSIERLWRQLARSFLLPTDAEPEKIMTGICDRWQTQDVILIFDKVDFMPPHILVTWLDVFWKPLVTIARQKLPEKDTHLLMFLLDNEGKVGQSNLMGVEEFSQFNDPIIPLKLPAVSPFSLEVIADWMDLVTPMESVRIPDGLTAQILFDNSENGIPQYLYEEICNRFGYSWEGGLAKWLI